MEKYREGWWKVEWRGAPDVWTSATVHQMFSGSPVWLHAFLPFSSSQTTGEGRLQCRQCCFEWCAPRVLILHCGTHIVLPAMHSDMWYARKNVSFECETGKENGNRAEEKSRWCGDFFCLWGLFNYLSVSITRFSHSVCVDVCVRVHPHPSGVLLMWRWKSLQAHRRAGSRNRLEVWQTEKGGGGIQHNQTDPIWTTSCYLKMRRKPQIQGPFWKRG